MHVCGNMGQRKHRKFNDKKSVNNRSKVTIFLHAILHLIFAANQGYLIHKIKNIKQAK